MTLLTASMIVSMGIAIFALLPWFFGFVRRYSRVAMVLGTLVLVGFCFFDLIPEMIEIGGTTSLAIMACSLALFWALHAMGGKHEGHDHGDETFLLGAMALHCFAGGMLLVSSYALSETLAYRVFLGLVLHKGFEAVAVSSVLYEKITSKARLFAYVGIYALSFPLGVLVTAWLRDVYGQGLQASAIEQVAMVITSIAVGNLMGCLWHDAAVPLFRTFRRNV